MGNSVEFFDNRSFVSPADFPSAKLFGEHGVSKIVVIQWELTMPSDLRHVLLSLQQGGMTIWRQDSYLPWSPRPMEIAPPNIVVRAWEWLWRALGYKKQMSGYFGGIRPASG